MKILIVDDEKTARYGIRKALDAGGGILEAGNLDEARTALKEHRPDVILLDLNLGGEDGFDLLHDTYGLVPSPSVIIITAHGSEKVAVDAMKKGAFDYLSKPFDIDELRLVVRNAAEHTALLRENARLRDALAAATAYGDLIGRSDSIRQVFSMIEKVAETDVTVLLTGESGSGKELVAREIHRAGPRANQELVTVNCAAIPDSLIESELFGHEKGAFTGALQRRIGRFEKARGGTIFLDEIGDMPLDTQAKILRVLEEKKIERLGGRQQIDVDVRIISATNRNLLSMVKEGTFREDLFYRLEVVNIHIPPLRDRKEDIPLLIEYFRDMFAERHSRKRIEFSPEAYSLLCRYSYPGNVRQLRNLIERLTVLAADGKVAVTDLPGEVRLHIPVADSDSLDASGLEALFEMKFREAREAFEKQYLLTRLAAHGNNITHTAESIGIHRQSLQQKIKDLDLKKQMD